MLQLMIAILVFTLLCYLLFLKLKNNECFIGRLNFDTNKTEWINKKLNNIREEFSFKNLKLCINKKIIVCFCVVGILVTFGGALLGASINSKVSNETVQASYSNNQIKGINLSNNDKNVDLNSVVKAGGEYAYLKATEGTTFKDVYMDSYYNTCKDLGMKVGAYHYLVSTSSPEDQARNFYEMISKYDWDLIPMLDVEVYFNGLEDYIKRFKDEFNRLSSLKLGIYSYTSFVNKYLSNVDKEIYDMPLWEANYNGKPWTGVGNNKFTNLVGHQYSTEEHIKEYIGNFNGDINEFNDKILISNEQ